MQIRLVIYIFLISALFSLEKKVIELSDGDRVIGEIINSSELSVEIKTEYGVLIVPREHILLIRELEVKSFDSSLSIDREYNQEARWKTIWSGMGITNSLYSWGIPYVLGIEPNQFTFGLQFMLIGGSFYAGYKYTEKMDLPLGRYQLQTNGAKLSCLSLFPIISMFGLDKWGDFDKENKFSLVYAMAAIPYGLVKADQYYQKHKLSNGQASMISHGTNLGLLNSLLSAWIVHPDEDLDIFTDNQLRMYSTAIFASGIAGGYYAHQFISGKEYTEDDAQFVSRSGILGFFNSLMFLSIFEPEDKEASLLAVMAGINIYTYLADEMNREFNLNRGESFIISLGAVAPVLVWMGAATIFDIESSEVWSLGNIISSTAGWYLTHNWVSKSMIENKLFGKANLRIDPTVLINNNVFYPGINFQASF
tara:strand:- start:2793 stop:4058 length:1266 start_codon:yes stop_codon:yes gene_type:complete